MSWLSTIEDDSGPKGTEHYSSVDSLREVSAERGLE
jgi:hypothetical protein